MRCLGVRGATSVTDNTRESIIAATREVLEEIVAKNDLSIDDVASVIFTATSDLDAAHPANAARELGWINTPLLCMQEMFVVGGLPRCVRVLILWNSERQADQVHHVYLGEARSLRPDLLKGENDD
ncbi:MAG TPA: chorismate mutase [Candidatus Acetothermia bacterium]|nr:chorismate mutase [Candidatus Acetothermia bacterium]